MDLVKVLIKHSCFPHISLLSHRRQCLTSADTVVQRKPASKRSADSDGGEETDDEPKKKISFGLSKNSSVNPVGNSNPLLGKKIGSTGLSIKLGASSQVC